MAADWSMLLLDLLDDIVMKITMVEDFIRFSVVCQGWNHATSLVKHHWKVLLPSLLFTGNTKENSNGVREIYNLDDNQIYQLKLPQTFGTRCWGSPYGWVVMADGNRNIQLFNPITRAQLHFPSLRFLNSYRDVIDKYFEECYHFLYSYLNKLIVLKVSQNDTSEFVIMVIYNNSKYLDFAKHGDKAWTSVSTKEYKTNRPWYLNTCIVDIVARNDHIFALYSEDSIVYWHANQFRSGELLMPLDYSAPDTLEVLHAHPSRYLMNIHGDLVMVVRYSIDFESEDGTESTDYGYRTLDFGVFKHNNELKRWEKIEDLGNVALFVGNNNSMSITLGVGQSMHHNPSHIVKDFGGHHDMGSYDMKLGTLQFSKHDDMGSLYNPSTWFFPKI